MKIWASLKHPNVLPLLGTVTDCGQVLSMVCPWMEEGDLAGYLSKNEDNLTKETRVNIASTRPIPIICITDPRPPFPSSVKISRTVYNTVSRYITYTIQPVTMLLFTQCIPSTSFTVT